jgi:hypothetical protein
VARRVARRRTRVNSFRGAFVVPILRVVSREDMNDRTGRSLPGSLKPFSTILASRSEVTESP